MIQFHNPHRKPSQWSIPRPCSTWGSKHGIKHYSLEVIQNPVRARQCGFGDKDRRPLAPAAVAKLIVRREDGSLVDVEDIDTSFFVAAADLWDETGQHEMNLVVHPSSDRNNVNKSSGKQKALSGGTSHARTHLRTSVPTAQDTPPPIIPPQVPPVGLIQEDKPILYQTYTTETGHPAWGYGPPVSMTYPLISSSSTPTLAQSPSPEHARDQPSYPTWNTDSSSSFDQALIDSATASSGNVINSSQNGLDASWTAPSQIAVVPQMQTTIEAPTADSLFSSAKPVTHPRKKHTSPSTPQKEAGTYTRTLMGPLSSPAYRLLDQHRQPGIFFLFQDLSVRTEGTFRLRLRLMNVGAPPAPEAGSTRVTDSASPILAQTFTSPFTIYSAKRFPGVPDTTALSIAFGNQGMKIPLRNRHGKRQRGASDDDSS